MLRDWLHKHGLTQAQLATRLGISAGFMSDLVSVRKRPSLEMAARISVITGGEVHPLSWFNDADFKEFEAGAISSPPGAGASSSLPSNTDGGRCGLDAPSNRNLQPNE